MNILLCYLKTLLTWNPSLDGAFVGGGGGGGGAFLVPLAVASSIGAQHTSRPILPNNKSDT